MTDRFPSRDARLRPALAAITLANLGLLVTWSLVVPTFRAPDEHVHHDLLRHLTTTWEYPDYDGLDVSRRTLRGLSASPAFPAHAGAVPADSATHRPDRSSWSDLGPNVRNGPPNQMPQHPPLYYEAAAVALRVLDGDDRAPLDRVVWQLRLLNVLAMAPLPLVAASIARRFTGSAPVVVSAAAGMLAIPQLTHIGATVSNDPPMIVLGSLALAGAARLATGDRRWATAVATGVLAGLALFTKGFAMPIVPAVALACLLPLARRSRTDADADADAQRDEEVPGRADRERAGPILGRAAVVASLALVCGGWWWIRNAVVYGTPQPGVRLRDRVPGVELDVLQFAGDFGDRLVSSFWGNVGWFEARIPVGVSAVLSVIVLAAAIAGCWRSWPRAVLLAPTVAATAMVLSAGWGAYKKTGVSYATQGRYLFTGAVGLMALAALGLARLARRRPWAQAAGTLVVALALQGAALWISVGHYWAGDGLVERLRAMAAFAPVPGAVTASCLAAALVAALAAVVVVGAAAQRHRPGPKWDKQPI